jgi:ribonuclease P protein component
MPFFTPAEHIRRRTDFQQAYDAGEKIHGRLMTLFVRPNGVEHARLGIAATRKIGGAVVRNRARRLAREVFRHRKPSTGLDIVVVPRREFPDASFAAIEHEFSSLLERAARRAASDRPGVRRARRDRRDPRV